MKVEPKIVFYRTDNPKDRTVSLVGHALNTHLIREKIIDQIEINLFIGSAEGFIEHQELLIKYELEKAVEELFERNKYLKVL